MPLYVDETGTLGSTSIVFLHGIGTSGWMWWRQISAFADFHCLNVDLPGHGKSNHITWASLTGTAHQVAAVIQSRATNGRAHVVGLSLGAHITLGLLQHHPDLLQRAVLSGVTAAPMPNRILLKPQIALMSILKRRWFADIQAKSLNLPAHAQAAFTENLLAMSMATYRRIWEEVAEFQVPSALQHVDTPTLITAGGNESTIIRQAVNVIPEMMPHAQGRIAPGRGHGWNIEAPDLFNAMVRAWITGTLLPSGLRVVTGGNTTSG
ncbi:MAG: alpha/beta fold hydrolase [Anaerolineae bacterium]